MIVRMCIALVNELDCAIFGCYQLLGVVYSLQLALSL